MRDVTRAFVPKKAVKVMFSGKWKRGQVETFIQTVLRQKKREAQLAPNGRLCTRCKTERTLSDKTNLTKKNATRKTLNNFLK